MSVDDTALRRAWPRGDAAAPAVPAAPSGQRGRAAGRAASGREVPPMPADGAPSPPPDGAPASPPEAPGTPVPAEPESPDAGSRPRHRAARRPQRIRPALSQPTGPHVRLGILWAAVTLGALLLGAPWVAGWLALVAALAAASAARTWGTPVVAERVSNRRIRVQPPAAVAALLAALVTVAALAGGLVMAVAVAAIAVILVAAATFGPLGQPDVLRRLVIVLAPGVAGGGVVLARSQGLDIALVLAGMVTVFDSSAYLIGTGAPNRWEGSVAGIASIAALTLFVAGVLSPPFSGASPFLLGGAAALLAPLGLVIGAWVTGDKTAPVPALRRLDSLFLVGPAWAVGAALLLHR